MSIKFPPRYTRLWVHKFGSNFAGSTFIASGYIIFIIKFSLASAGSGQIQLWQFLLELLSDRRHAEVI